MEVIKIYQNKYGGETQFKQTEQHLNLKKNKNGICGALRDLIPFGKFKKREKHPWRSVNFSKVAGFY